MPKSKSNDKDNNIWSKITDEELIAAIISLDDRVDQLEKESWRLKKDKDLSVSLWGEIILKLKLEHTEKMRHSLYNIWHSTRHRHIQERVKEALKKNNYINNINDNAIKDLKNESVSEINNASLHPDPSIPLPEPIHTRAKQSESVKNNTKRVLVGETSFILTPAEWKIVFSKTRKCLKEDWIAFFRKKMESCGIKCSLRFGDKHVKKGKRKRSCRYFWFDTFCGNSTCNRFYRAILQNEVDSNSSPMFRVRIYGDENHNPDVETMACQLRGEERHLIGERANAIGPTAVFRERVEAANEELLAAGNLTRCETVGTIKKAGADYRKKHRFDEDIFQECRIISSTYRLADVDSMDIQGYVQVVGEMPFRTHLFSEPQIKRYVQYCRSKKYSFVHIDATGGVMRRISDQNPPLLYAILFKHGSDPINNIPLAHAILTDNTVPSISYFLGNLAHAITNHKKKLILPSFFVIDFSAALMNSILLSFNGENIVTHLNRCWNVISGKYNNVELRSLSFIHLCCCHVIHAIARSLSEARIDKQIRKSLLHIFAFILCSNDLEQLYDILGTLVNIFGNPDEENAKQKFEDMLSLPLNVDEESATMLQDRKKIFEEAEADDQLKLVDEYLRSNDPIIHQSPFNVEAIKRYPILKNLLDNKLKYNNTPNSMFSRSIIRIIYRWWAYLPLWTGLLWNFEERYSNNLQKNLSVTYCPIRHSNAAIESYFRTLKASILQKKVQPDD